MRRPRSSIRLPAPQHADRNAQGRPWWKDQALRVLQRNAAIREGLNLYAIVDAVIGSYDPDRMYYERDEYLCIVESVCNELVLEGHADQVWHGPWPEQRYRTASLLELLAMAAR